MEEKINNKRIFRYIPSIIAKMILELDLNDEDVFFNKSFKKLSSITSKRNIQSHNLKKIIEHQSSIQTNEEIFPVEYPLSHSIIMSVKLIGFQDLILTLSLKDKKKQNEKLNCEFIPIIFSKILLQISSILSENGGEILKCEDFEFIAVWDFSNIEDIRLLPKYQRFYAKHALISAYDIMKKIDDIEIVKNYKLKISMGIEYGESSIYFFGGERRRSDYVLMGETIEGSELCLNQCNPHEIIIGRELNNIFKRKGEIISTQLGTDDKHKNLYKLNLEDIDEYELKNFQDNNISLPMEGGDNSTKISASTNIKFGDKSIPNNEESAHDSTLILNNSLNKMITNFQKEDIHIPVDINNKILYNFEKGTKNEAKSRNINKLHLKNKSQDNDFSSLLKNSLIEDKVIKTIKYQNKSYDNSKFNEDFTYFKDKNKFSFKHVNIISNQDENNSVQILKVFPSYKFNNTNFSKNLNYKNIYSTDPKYMYIDYYHDNTKIHKSKIFDFRYKK